MSGATFEHSPLGDAAAVERTRAAYPALGEHIDDLESIITPEFDRADRAAIDTQARLKQNRLIEMAGGALVAVFALVRLGVGDRAQWAGGAAAIVAGATGVIAIAGRRHGLDQWLDSRRIAEELRSLYFRWLTSIGDTDRTQRRRQLRAEVNRIISVEPIRIGAELTGLDASNTAAEPIGDQAWRLYRDARLRDQLEWMRGKSESVRTRTQALQTAQVVMMGGAAVCGLLSSYVTGDEGRLLAVPVAASAAVIGFLATVDTVTVSDQLAQHYQRTVRRLDVIDRALADERGSLDDVEEIEAVLMAEHRTWHRLTEGNQQ